MDEKELEGLFLEAPGEPPPPGFTAADVATASRRATAKRRGIVAGVAAAVVMLGGVGTAIGVLSGPAPSEQTTAAAPQTESAPTAQRGNAENDQSGQPESEAERHPSAQVVPQDSPKQGDESNGKTDPRVGSTAGCDKVDRELAIALAGELPVTASGAARPASVCPSGARTAALPFEGGTVDVVLVPQGGETSFQWAEGTATARQRTAEGATVVVASVPEPGSRTPPFADRLDDIATALAERF
ncbi:hypothetical protein BAY61_30630 [Prauserella marina]|uniref:Uncharacterized protein n=1 Tax=Prauserella marina TaxID=530584 RepID=A0A222VXJ4_9PSEU|nr:hypothetical protein [Prauserella marina]ASR38634.1 hypothetical protein BAY61_30630 [Prauserella marina]PWV81961.1 hypothetical protein DES30_102195 [Prauserella marina]SDD16255.1 hypothetical protein SAMN05421630_106195 [Prauserella marina]